MSGNSVQGDFCTMFIIVQYESPLSIPLQWIFVGRVFEMMYCVIPLRNVSCSFCFGCFSCSLSVQIISACFQLA